MSWEMPKVPENVTGRRLYMPENVTGVFGPNKTFHGRPLLNAQQCQQDRIVILLHLLVPGKSKEVSFDKESTIRHMLGHFEKEGIKPHSRFQGEAVHTR